MELFSLSIAFLMNLSGCTTSTIVLKLGLGNCNGPAFVGTIKSLKQPPNTISHRHAHDILQSYEGAAEELKGPYISPEGRIINKKRKLYSVGNLQHVDDLFIGKYRVEWTVRGVQEKLQFRRRESKSVPLKTSRFSLAGIGGFLLKLWLDGHSGTEQGHIALSLVQQEHWATLETPICLFAGKIIKGPFFFRSGAYFRTARSLCPLDDAVENNELCVGVTLAELRQGS